MCFSGCYQEIEKPTHRMGGILTIFMSDKGLVPKILIHRELNNKKWLFNQFTNQSWENKIRYFFKEDI